MTTAFEDNTHVFIVRIWLERRELKNAPPVWRGVIENVLTGERRHLKDLDGVMSFIHNYLSEMGMESGTAQPNEPAAQTDPLVDSDAGAKR